MASDRNERASASQQATSKEAVQTVMKQFETYAGDVQTRLEHGALAGTAGDRVREEADRLVAEYRRRIESSDGLAAARKWFEEFKDRAQNLRP